MKHLFKLSILLIGILLIIVGCQKDDQTENPESETTVLKRIDFENHNWRKISKQHPILRDKLKYINGAKDSNNRLITSSNYNFTIDDTQVQIIEQENGSTTYAFYVYRDQETPNVLENYVFQVYPDGGYAQYLISFTYELDSDGKRSFDNTEPQIERIEDDSLLLLRATPCVPEIVNT